MVSCPRYAEEYLTYLAWQAGRDGYDVCIILTLGSVYASTTTKPVLGKNIHSTVIFRPRKPVELH